MQTHKHTRTGILVLLGCLLLGSGLWAQHYPSMQAGYFYGTPGPDEPRVLASLPGGRLLLGGSALGADSTQDALLLCTDSLGQQLWQRRITGSHTQQLDGILVADTAIWVWGRTGAGHLHTKSGSQPFATDAFVASFSLQGQPRYYHQLHSTTQDRIWAVQLASTDLLSLVIQADHALQLLQLHLPTGRADSLPVPQRLQGQVPLAAATVGGAQFLLAMVDVQDSTQLMVARLGADGQLVQLRLHSYTYHRPQPQCIQATPDGGYVVAGHRWAGTAGTEAWLLRTLRSGALAYERSWPLGGSVRVAAVAMLPDGGSLLVANAHLGSTHALLKGMQDVLLLRLDGSGHLLWQQSYGGAANERAVALLTTPNGNLWVLAQKENHFAAKPATRGADYWLLQLCELPCASQPLGIRLDADAAAVPRGRVLRLSTNVQLTGVYHWDFGDGTHSTLPRPAKTYDQAGEYRISLTLRLSETCLRVCTYPSVIRVVP